MCQGVMNYARTFLFDRDNTDTLDFMPTPSPLTNAHHPVPVIHCRDVLVVVTFHHTEEQFIYDD